ncbi:MAG: acetoacetate decarboxylase family protein [Peptoniphilaceae bacterium]|nr:acetoacetate decarboxylase family protein [Peptoniphilaceae bacterium]
MEQEYQKKTFAVTNADLANFRKESNMLNQEGIYLVFRTKAEAVRELLPPPFEITDPCFAYLSVTHIKNPTFADPYYETILSVAAKYDGKPAAYPLSLLLGGQGAEMATVFGREFGAMPKKLGCEFNIRRNGDEISVAMARRGAQIIDLRMTLGDYNHPMADTCFGKPYVGKENKGQSYFIYWDRLAGIDPVHHEDQTALLRSHSTMIYRKWEPGSIDLKLGATEDDPWGCLPVVEMLGGAWCVNDLILEYQEWVQALKAEEVKPKILYAWYDKTGFGHLGRN